jgi:hypothetical protein
LIDLSRIQCDHAVLLLGDDAFQHFALMICGLPDVVRHPVDLHVDLVQVALSLLACAHRFHPSVADLGGDHRAEPVP